MKIIGVVFKDLGSSMFFNCNDNDICVDDYVIVSSPRGELFGKVSSTDVFSDDISGDVVRRASDRDYEIYLNNCRYAKNVLIFARSVADDLGLEMSFVDACYNFDRSHLLISFTADGRIDFRDLVKKIAYRFRTRIDMRQIGIRDRAKKVCGLGFCGKELCCSSFLGQFNSVSVAMAKNQNISINPSKINGACGRLLCCLAYEDDIYSDYKSKLPSVGDFVLYNDVSCQVIAVNVLKLSYSVNFNNEIKEVFIDE